MNDIPRRTDSWVQWAGVILAIAGAVWNTSGRLSRIEQELRDDAHFRMEETQRVNDLEKQFQDWLQNQAARRVGP
jgi:dsRNA-specific ribonuclease